MHVLLFSWFYPPFQSAGASRSGQLAKYLVAAGVRVSVVTGRPRDLPLGADIDPGAEVHYAGHLELNAFPQFILGRTQVESHGYEFSRLGRLGALAGIYKRLVHLPDAQAGWIVPAARAAASLDSPDVVMSSSPPASAHVAAAIYALRRGIPWVAEYRSPWTDNPHFIRWQPLRSIERSVERRIGRRATVVTAISQHLRRTLEIGLGREVVHLPNGYDPDDFVGEVPVEPGLCVHLGSVYVAYPTQLLLDALPLLRRPRRILFAGRNLADLPDRLRRSGMQSLVERPGPLPRRRAIDLIRRAHVNIVFVTREATATGYTTGFTDVPQKMYEYFASGRPILAIGPMGSETADTLRRSGIATFAESPATVAECLEAVPEPSIDPDWVSQFSYARITQGLVSVLEKASRS